MAEEKKKILIIEDEPAVLENIVELLDTGAYDVRGAENGLSGVKMARDFLPDLIVCDIMMPEIDGFGVLEALQKDTVTNTIPFIFLTAKSELNDIREGMLLGADDYLTKPFLPKELYAAIETRLEKQTRQIRKGDNRLQELRMNIASSLPHELRTPLNGILASSQILTDYFDTMDVEEVKQLHRNIYSSSKRLYGLIARYLLYSDVELLFYDSNRKEKLKENCRPIDTSEFIFTRFKAMAEKQGRSENLVFTLEEAPVIMHDEHFIHICDELATNAFKFSNSDTTVNVNAARNNENFILRVRNEGRGMTRQQANMIGAYVQFDRKVYEQQGSGLGLIITKRLAQIYGGKLEIESEKDKFTEIIVTLPVDFRNEN